MKPASYQYGLSDPADSPAENLAGQARQEDAPLPNRRLLGKPSERPHLHYRLQRPGLQVSGKMRSAVLFLTVWRSVAEHAS